VAVTGGLPTETAGRMIQAIAATTLSYVRRVVDADLRPVRMVGVVSAAGQPWTPRSPRPSSGARHRAAVARRSRRASSATTERRTSQVTGLTPPRRLRPKPTRYTSGML
jgi:hypothetical protein